MDITEIDIRLVDEKDRPNNRILAYASVVFDNQLVVHDVRVIRGHSGLIAAMPDRMLTDRCFSCHAKNGIRYEYCCQCGVRIDRARRLQDGWVRTHKDVVHPLDLPFRWDLQSTIIDAYRKEVARRSPSPAPASPGQESP